MIFNLTAKPIGKNSLFGRFTSKIYHSGILKWFALCLPFLLVGCGYHLVTWDHSTYKSIHVRQIRSAPEHAPHAALFQQALNDRCLAMSGLRLETAERADIILESTLHSLVETIIATDSDRRVRQVQFTLLSSFKLLTADHEVLWQVDNYRFSDQYEVSTTRDIYKNDAASSMNKAYRNIAEMVVTHFSISLSREKK